MKGKMLIFLLFIMLSCFHNAYADTIIWTGNVYSNGSRTQNIQLQNGREYYFIVEGSVYFGRWWQNGRNLLNDACYEFNARVNPQYLPVFKNSLGVPFNNTAYRSDHIYRSINFKPSGWQSINFWIFDTDYRDNRGSLRVSLILVDQVQPQGGIAGTWDWFNGSTVIINSNGTMQSSGGNYGTWMRSGSQFILRWRNGGWVDTLTLSIDGRRLEGKNQYSGRVWATKRSSPVDQVQPQGGIVGTWDWFNGSTVIIRSNGTMQSSSGNYGTWMRSGSQFILRWRKGGWVDTLTLSNDGRRLEGTNQNFGRVWATKR